MQDILVAPRGVCVVHATYLLLLRLIVRASFVCVSYSRQCFSMR